MIKLEDPRRPEEHEQIQAHRNLWSAVMHSAITDLAGKNYIASHNRDDSASNFWRQTARAWVTSDDVFHGSFVWVCGVLDLNVEDVRARLLDGRVHHVRGAIGRPRNVGLLHAA